MVLRPVHGCVVARRRRYVGDDPVVGFALMGRVEQGEERLALLRYHGERRWFDRRRSGIVGRLRFRRLLDGGRLLLLLLLIESGGRDGRVFFRSFLQVLLGNGAEDALRRHEDR